ncbi:MAG: hypothetical protein PHW40_05200 [Candidatus Izemoplasmatales bacterium]|nr:hypothetical protein [Candidatus Izemoplasmatales bacterium]
MKKLMTALSMLFLLVLSGCFQSRVQLFTINLVEGTFSMDPTTDIFFLEHQITRFDLVFVKNDDVTHKVKDYETNLMGDFSFEEIIVFEIQLTIGLDGVDKVYDAQFMGVANPQRSNAYRFLVAIPEISSDLFHIVLDLDGDKDKDELETMSIQIKDFVNTSPNQQDAYFNIYRQQSE